MNGMADGLAKHLKFADALVEPVRFGLKDTTWRIDDEKGLAVGDMLSLWRSDGGSEFAVAAVVEVAMRTFGTLRVVDKLGHEPFPDRVAMLATYGRYYRRYVGLETPVKVIRFRLVGTVGQWVVWDLGDSCTELGQITGVTGTRYQVQPLRGDETSWDKFTGRYLFFASHDECRQFLRRRRQGWSDFGFGSWPAAELSSP